MGTNRTALDFSRPMPTVAHLHLYTEEGEADPSSLVQAPPGWEFFFVPDSLPIPDSDGRIHRIIARAVGKAFAPGSPVLFRSNSGEHRVYLASPSLTTWTLEGPFVCGDGDPLEVGIAHARGSAPARSDTPDKASPSLPRRLEHLGLSSSNYVNLTATLEDMWGPIASGEYPVWRRYALAQTTLILEHARSVVLRLTGEDRFHLIVNGTDLVTTREPVRSRAAFANVDLAAGANSLMLICAQDGTREWGGRRWGFELDIRDWDREGQGKVLVSIDPGLRRA